MATDSRHAWLHPRSRRCHSIVGVCPKGHCVWSQRKWSEVRRVSLNVLCWLTLVHCSDLGLRSTRLLGRELAIYCTYLCHSHASIRWSLLGLHRRVIAGSVATQGSFPRADLERCVKSWESSSRGWGAAAPRCGPGGTV